MQLRHQWQRNTDQHHYEENSRSLFMLNQRKCTKKSRTLCAIKPTLSLHFIFFMFSLILIFNFHLPLIDKKELQCASVPKFNPRTHETKSLLLHKVHSLLKNPVKCTSRLPAAVRCSLITKNPPHFPDEMVNAR